MYATIEQFIKDYREGLYDSVEVMFENEHDVWYDWFCANSSLKNRTAQLAKLVLRLTSDGRLNTKTDTIQFKNCCPASDDPLYDCIYIYQPNSEWAQYRITFKSARFMRINGELPWTIEIPDPDNVGCLKAVEHFKSLIDVAKWLNTKPDTVETQKELVTA
jgi:hypothetical protein